ncbi:MAG: hypothetical protein ACYCY8_11550 [Burkholderiales bacterium]
MKHIAYRALKTKDIPGLPADISLLFERVQIRFYKSQEHSGCFTCTMAIPDIKDEDGVIFERGILSSLASEEDEDFLDDHEVSLNDHTFDSLPKAASCSFEDKTEMGKRMLLLNIKNKGDAVSRIRPN